MATLRADGRWMARKRVKGERISGYGATAEEAEADLQAKLTLTAPLARQKLVTLHDLSETLWTPHIERLAPFTARRYVSSYVNHIREPLGHYPLQKIDTLVIREWLAKSKATDYSKSFALDVLTNLLGHAVRADLIPKNPCSNVSFPRPQSERERILELDAALELLDCSKETPVSAPVFLAAVLGLRRAEIAGLKWEDLNRRTGELRIRRQRQSKKGQGVIERELKTRSSKRTLYLTPELIEHIDQRGDLDSPYITTFIGHPWIPDRITEKWVEATAKWAEKEDGLKLQDWHFHDLRRLAAGLLVAAGQSLEVVAAVLGHSKPDMSAVYVSVADSKRKEGVKALAELLGRQKV